MLDTKPVFSCSIFVSVRCRNGMRVFIWDVHAFRHLLCIFPFIFFPIFAHWNRWSPLVSKSCLHNGQMRRSFVSHNMLSRRHLSTYRLKRKRLLCCLFSRGVLDPSFRQVFLLSCVCYRSRCMWRSRASRFCVHIHEES